MAGNRTLHADPYGKDGPDKSFGVLINDNMAAPKRPRRDHAQVNRWCDIYINIIETGCLFVWTYTILKRLESAFLLKNYSLRMECIGQS